MKELDIVKIEKEKSLAEALMITVAAESEANIKLLTPEYLIHKWIQALAKNTVILIGIVPNLAFIPGNAIAGSHY